MQDCVYFNIWQLTTGPPWTNELATSEQNSTACKSWGLGPQRAGHRGFQKSANQSGAGLSLCSQVMHLQQEGRQGGGTMMNNTHIGSIGLAFLHGLGGCLETLHPVCIADIQGGLCSPCALQDLKCFVFSLISAHFKIQPIQK